MLISPSTQQQRPTRFPNTPVQLVLQLAILTMTANLTSYTQRTRALGPSTPARCPSDLYRTIYLRSDLLISLSSRVEWRNCSREASSTCLCWSVLHSYLSVLVRMDFTTHILDCTYYWIGILHHWRILAFQQCLELPTRRISRIRSLCSSRQRFVQILHGCCIPIICNCHVQQVGCWLGVEFVGILVDCFHSYPIRLVQGQYSHDFPCKWFLS